MSRFPKVALFLATVTLLGCPQADDGPPPVSASLAPGAPRLVLFLVVDQMRQDYLERFRPLLGGGLGRLLEEGVVFTDAHHDHAATMTAPGHASLMTGAHPSRHGVIANRWRDRQGEAIYCVRDPEGLRSPRWLEASTLGDWLKAASPASKVFTASGKDRSAILMGGFRADAAFWYDQDEGHFITSSYYPEVERPWHDAFAEQRLLDPLFSTAWEPLPEVTVHAAEYAIEPLDRGFLDFQLPHPLGGLALQPGEGFYGALYATPFVDSHLTAFARALIDGEQIGADEVPDLLALSYSALDTVGHNFGPDSPEFLDTLLRLDRTLGELLEFVDDQIGLEHVLVSLSSDHGVTAIPEVRLAKGTPALRFGVEEIGCVQRVGLALAERFGNEEWLIAGSHLDEALAAERGVAVSELEEAIRHGLEACPGHARVWTRTELTDAGAPDDEPMRRLFVNSFHPERSPHFEVQYEPHTLTSSSIETTHGSPYAYDTWVPWIVRSPDGVPRTLGERVHTVDVAPTLAALIGLETDTVVDGVDRSGVIVREVANDLP